MECAPHPDRPARSWGRRRGGSDRERRRLDGGHRRLLSWKHADNSGDGILQLVADRPAKIQERDTRALGSGPTHNQKTVGLIFGDPMTHSSRISYSLSGQSPVGGSFSPHLKTASEDSRSVFGRAPTLMT